MTWEGLSPPYRTIVADPPWDHSDGWPPGEWSKDKSRRHPLPYSVMAVADIAALPVAAVSDSNSHLYLWTTNRYLRESYQVVEAWGFRPSQMLVWCKPLMGWRPGGHFGQTTEYVLLATRGSGRLERGESTYYVWPRGSHSTKPSAFYDLVERVSPPPRLELFARQPRMGWDSWGWGYEEVGA